MNLARVETVLKNVANPVATQALKLLAFLSGNKPLPRSAGLKIRRLPIADWRDIRLAAEELRPVERHFLFALALQPFLPVLSNTFLSSALSLGFGRLDMAARLAMVLVDRSDVDVRAPIGPAERFAWEREIFVPGLGVVAVTPTAKGTTFELSEATSLDLWAAAWRPSPRANRGLFAIGLLPTGKTKVTFAEFEVAGKFQSFDVPEVWLSPRGCLQQLAVVDELAVSQFAAVRANLENRLQALAPNLPVLNAPDDPPEDLIAYGIVKKGLALGMSRALWERCDVWLRELAEGPRAKSSQSASSMLELARDAGILPRAFLGIASSGYLPTSYLQGYPFIAPQIGKGYTKRMRRHFGRIFESLNDAVWRPEREFVFQRLASASSGPMSATELRNNTQHFDPPRATSVLPGMQPIILVSDPDGKPTVWIEVAGKLTKLPMKSQGADAYRGKLPSATQRVLVVYAAGQTFGCEFKP